MKTSCRCGWLVVDSEATQKYVWSTTEDWLTLLDTFDEEIERIEDDSMKEAAMMRVRYAVKTGPVWECPNCGRLITLKDGNSVFFRRESS